MVLAALSWPGALVATVATAAGGAIVIALIWQIFATGRAGLRHRPAGEDLATDIAAIKDDIAHLSREVAQIRGVGSGPDR